MTVFRKLGITAAAIGYQHMKKTFVTFLGISVALVGAALGQTFNGNGATGFGGPVGGGSLSFNVSGTSVTGTFTRGTGGGFNDGFVIYIDSIAGGLTDTSSLTDTGMNADYNRKMISGFNGTDRSTLSFAAGFQADFAIALAVGPAQFGGLWSLSDPTNLPFVADLMLTPNNNTTAPTYTFSFSLGDIGLTAGNTFKITTSYLNANDAYRSNESIGNGLSGTAGDGNGNFARNAAMATNFVTVPEPSTIVLLSAPLLLGVLARRRKG